MSEGKQKKRKKEMSGIIIKRKKERQKERMKERN